MKQWNELKEQSAGRWRILLLWWIYRLLGPWPIVILLLPIVSCIYPFAKAARQASRQFREHLNHYRSSKGLPTVHFSPFWHIYAYACSILEKVDAMALRKSIQISISPSADAECLRHYAEKGEGLFLLCSHVGNVEVLPALSSTFTPLANRQLHSFIQMHQNSIFFDFYQRHATLKNHTFHDVGKIDLATAIFTSEAIQRGDIFIMAADRTPASGGRTIAAPFLDGTIQLPIGAFRFARMIECPIFFIAAIRKTLFKYELHVQLAPRETDKTLRAAYLDFITNLTLQHPTQFYNFWDMWGKPCDSNAKTATPAP